jgi:serine/threonine-protein kinase
VRASQLTGAVLNGRYKLHGYLRRGVSSRVYLAEDVQSGGSVVVKLLSPSAAADASRRTRIRIARQSLVPIVHPNLVDVLGVDETKAEVPYLVMEALAGEALDETLRREGTLPLDLALVVARQTAAGLLALHQGGVVHGDLRPENLMLLGAPSEPYGIKIMNYGIARDFREGPPDAFDPLRAAYLAPEQLLDDRAQVESDVYALGVLLLELLCGRLPFQEPNQSECVRRQLASQPLDAFWLDLALDARLEAIVVNATRKNPRNRYRSARAVLDALDAIVGLSSEAVELLPLAQTPDAYEPSTTKGKQRFAELMRPEAENSARAP